MGIWDAADAAGHELHIKNEINKAKEEAKEEGKKEKEEEQKRHEENKEQGMI